MSTHIPKSLYVCVKLHLFIYRFIYQHRFLCIPIYLSTCSIISLSSNFLSIHVSISLLSVYLSFAFYFRVLRRISNVIAPSCKERDYILRLCFLLVLFLPLPVFFFFFFSRSPDARVVCLLLGFLCLYLSPSLSSWYFFLSVSSSSVHLTLLVFSFFLSYFFSGD